MEGVDDIAFLAASEHRVAILAALRESGPATRDDLVEATGAARVTVARNLEQLAERGYVREHTAGYRLTLVGEFVAGAFCSLVETVEAAAELEPLLEHLPRDFDLDPGELADAEVTASTRANPYAPVQHHERALESARDVRVVLPAIGGGPLDTLLERVEAGELEVDAVVSPDVAEIHRSPEYADRTERMLESGHCSLSVYDGEVPFYLGLVDGTVQIGVDDEDGIPRALAESDAPRVREWAESTYESYRAAAEPFEFRGE